MIRTMFIINVPYHGIFSPWLIFRLFRHPHSRNGENITLENKATSNIEHRIKLRNLTHTIFLCIYTFYVVYNVETDELISTFFYEIKVNLCMEKLLHFLWSRHHLLLCSFKYLFHTILWSDYCKQLVPEMIS